MRVNWVRQKKLLRDFSSAIVLTTTTLFDNHCLTTFLYYDNRQRWARVPGFAFPRARVPGILGARARENANFIQERGRIGTLNLRSCEEMTPNRLPASILVHRTRVTRGG